MTGFIRLDFLSQADLENFLRSFSAWEHCWVPSEDADGLDLNEPTEDLEEPFAIFAVDVSERDEFAFALGEMSTRGHEFSVVWSA